MYRTGDLPFPTEKWSKSAAEVKTWDDWLAMQGGLSSRVDAILSGANTATLWKNASRPRPDEADLRQSLWRIQSEFLSRVLTVGMAIKYFGLDPYAKPITIHLAGASHSETMGARLTDYDELNHMFPGHQGIEIVMVGPEVVDGPIMRPPLRAFGPRQRVYISAYKALYHQFWEDVVEKEEAVRPDLVVGFHPGRYRQHPAQHEQMQYTKTTSLFFCHPIFKLANNEHDVTAAINGIQATWSAVPHIQ